MSPSQIEWSGLSAGIALDPCVTEDSGDLWNLWMDVRAIRGVEEVVFFCSFIVIRVAAVQYRSSIMDTVQFILCKHRYSITRWQQRD